MPRRSKKEAIYAGSFDPWSFGHAFVLESSIEIFDTVHICVAVNRAKQGVLSAPRRSYLIARSLAPFMCFGEDQSSFRIGDKVTVTYTHGLVSDFAKKKDIHILLRGLRSTSDFEAEFNLYFSNYAISQDIKTWTVMCPPELLHCSSTYVRTVVGQPSVSFVGTGFLSQCMVLEKSTLLGEIFDLLVFLEENEKNKASLIHGNTPAGRLLQTAFSSILTAAEDAQLAELQTRYSSAFREKRQQTSVLNIDPFHLDEQNRQILFEHFSDVIRPFCKDLFGLKLDERASQCLETIRLAQSIRSCCEGLTEVWNSNH